MLSRHLVDRARQLDRARRSHLHRNTAIARRVVAGRGVRCVNVTRFTDGGRRQIGVRRIVVFADDGVKLSGGAEADLSVSVRGGEADDGVKLSGGAEADLSVSVRGGDADDGVNCLEAVKQT